MSDLDREKYYELMCYTLARPDSAFLHQNVVDAYTAQNGQPSAKPIAAAFALVGLYLHLERGFTGKQVQLAHMRMGRQRKNWPRFVPPESRGKITVRDVLAAPAGRARDEMIRKWCSCVWEAWKGSRERIIELTKQELFG
jgi:Family of unknown function (DUF5946)